MKKLYFTFLCAILLMGCKSYSALEHMPYARIPSRLPSLEIEVDQQSFATVTGYSQSVGVGFGTSVFGGTSAVYSGTSVNYASKALLDISTVFKKDMYEFVDKIGEKKGKIVCRMVDGSMKPNYGMAILSGATLCVFNLFGMPFASAKGTMMIEVDFLDKDNNIVASYQSQSHKKKSYYALYYGYSDAENVALLEAFKMCLEDINQQIRYDYNNLKTHFID